MQKLLREHAPEKLLAFMFKHGQAAAACQLLFPPTGASASADANDYEPVTDRCTKHPCLIALLFEVFRIMQHMAYLLLFPLATFCLSCVTNSAHFRAETSGIWPTLGDQLTEKLPHGRVRRSYFDVQVW